MIDIESLMGLIDINGGLGKIFQKGKYYVHFYKECLFESNKFIEINGFRYTDVIQRMTSNGI